jgi:molybdate transport system regulatory protein
MAYEFMKIAYKVWLDDDGKFFGEGPYWLLKGIEKTGSLHQAAAAMDMSYRKAWLTIQKAEKKLGFPLLDRKVGGTSGGGSQITPQGQIFKGRYEQFRDEVKKCLEAVYLKHFG